MTSQNHWKSNGMEDWILFVIAQLIYLIQKRMETTINEIINDLDFIIYPEKHSPQ